MNKDELREKIAKILLDLNPSGFQARIKRQDALNKIFSLIYDLFDGQANFDAATGWREEKELMFDWVRQYNLTPFDFEAYKKKQGGMSKPSRKAKYFDCYCGRRLRINGVKIPPHKNMATGVLCPSSGHFIPEVACKDLKF